MKVIVFIVSVFFTTMALGQEQPDSIPSKRLDAVEVRGQRLYDIDRMPEYESTNLWTGKKNEVINIQSLNANIAEKTGRRFLQRCRVYLFMIWMEAAIK